METQISEKDQTLRPIEDDRIGRFPIRLKEAMGDRSARAFARTIGLSDKVVRQYLSGKSEPTRPALVAMADSAGVSVQWLATGEGPKEKGEIGRDFDRWSSFHYLYGLMLDTFDYNKKNEKNCSLSIYLAYFSEQQKDSLIDTSLYVTRYQGRIHHTIQCENMTLIEIAEIITGGEFKTKYEAYCSMSDFINENNDVFIFCDLSKSKESNNKNFYRDIIKIIDKDPFDKKTPKGDIVFLDSSSFLEKHWESLGVYLRTNILNGSSFII